MGKRIWLKVDEKRGTRIINYYYYSMGKMIWLRVDEKSLQAFCLSQLKSVEGE
jgi:hypothetical protein